MAASPVFKVYSKDGEYLASVKYIIDAAAIVSVRGEGTQIRYGHQIIVWVEGKEADQAGNSYDFCAETAFKRAHTWDLLHTHGSPHYYSGPGLYKIWNRAMLVGAGLEVQGLKVRDEVEE